MFPHVFPLSRNVCSSPSQFLASSAGSVRERLEAMFDICAAIDESTGDRVVTRERFVTLLRDLMRTGQVPSERQVGVDDGGKNALGVSRSWYTVSTAWELTPEELAEVSLAEVAVGGGDKGGGEGGGEGGDERGLERKEGLEVEAFIKLLTGKRLCVWGECEQVARRERIAREAAEVRDPPTLSTPPPTHTP